MHAQCCGNVDQLMRCDRLLLQADLAGRDFTAERGEAVVISTGAVVSDLDRERGARERAEAQVGVIDEFAVFTASSASSMCASCRCICLSFFPIRATPRHPCCLCAAAQKCPAWVVQVRHAHRLRIPRRPAWDRGMSPDELDARERAAFLAWRRDLAQCVFGKPVLPVSLFNTDVR